jgi:glutamyl-tRNA reductase
LRERLAIPARDVPVALGVLRGEVELEEAVILSTCNRIELYVSSPNPSTNFQDLVNFLALRSRVAPETLQRYLYCLAGRQIIAHLFRVTAGLDSMILGESEVTAQVKHAYAVAQEHGTIGPVFHRLFQRALHCAKVVRTRTRIAEGQASIGSVVLALAKQHFGERLTHCETLLWGAGKAAETTARYLIKNGIGQLWVVNRTKAKAQELASMCAGGWLSWEQALKHLAHADLAIVCTQAPHYVIDETDLATILPQRHGRPLLVIDLAVPRNVDPAIADQPSIFLYNIDDLQTIAHAAVQFRQQELVRCETLLEEQVRHFLRWWETGYQQEARPCQAVEAFASV